MSYPVTRTNLTVSDASWVTSFYVQIKDVAWKPTPNVPVQVNAAEISNFTFGIGLSSGVSVNLWLHNSLSATPTQRADDLNENGSGYTTENCSGTLGVAEAVGGAKYPLNGSLTFAADASGNLQPVFDATAKLTLDRVLQRVDAFSVKVNPVVAWEATPNDPLVVVRESPSDIFFYTFSNALGNTVWLWVPGDGHTPAERMADMGWGGVEADYAGDLGALKIGAGTATALDGLLTISEDTDPDSPDYGQYIPIFDATAQETLNLTRWPVVSDASTVTSFHVLIDETVPWATTPPRAEFADLIVQGAAIGYFCFMTDPQGNQFSILLWNPLEPHTAAERFADYAIGNLEAWSGTLGMAQSLFDEPSVFTPLNGSMSFALNTAGVLVPVFDETALESLRLIADPGVAVFPSEGQSGFQAGSTRIGLSIRIGL